MLLHISGRCQAVAVYPKTGTTPEAMIKVLITVIDKTPAGGATRENLKDAYSEVKGDLPTDRTIYRIIRRINELFDPLAYNSMKAKGRGKNSGGSSKKDLTIESFINQTGSTRYRYNGNKIAGSRDSNQALLVILGLYSQQKGILKGHFEKVISSLLREAVAKKHDEDYFFTGADEHIYVSGFGSTEPKRTLKKISEIIRAIDNCKVINIDYMRTKDGKECKREIEPYGLVCRHGSWYLVGFCRRQQGRRIYLMDQVKRLEVVENSVFQRPSGLSMKTIFSNAWGIWNLDDKDLTKLETVRLKATKGVAERFKAVIFHDSQKVKMLSGDEAEITYTVSGAGEMIPWLMSWGPTLEVIEPQWLKDELKNNLQSTLQLYCS
jgi:predicted DNA-binding transcriptional regulator YafY